MIPNFQYNTFRRDQSLFDGLGEAYSRSEFTRQFEENAREFEENARENGWRRIGFSIFHFNKFKSFHESKSEYFFEYTYYLLVFHHTYFSSNICRNKDSMYVYVQRAEVEKMMTNFIN